MSWHLVGGLAVESVACWICLPFYTSSVICRDNYGCLISTSVF